MKRTVMLGLFVLIAVLAGIFMWHRQTQAPSSPALIGGQEDEHGCLAGAGYSWCEAKATCIRVWEEYCTAAEAKRVVFACAENKEVQATFYPGDDKYVDLVLSDGAALSLPRAMSGSGARYTIDDESVVFWNKGDTAFITENGTTTYADCALKAQ